jgi:AraC-like DNA-binding protein
MKFFKSFCFLFLFLASTSLCQEKNNLKKLDYDEIRDLGFDTTKSFKQRLGYFKKYLLKGEQEKNSHRITMGYYYCAYHHYDIDDKLAIQYLDSAIICSRQLPDTLFPAVAYREKAMLQVRKSDFKAAIDNYKLAEYFALKNNSDYYYLVRDAIATVKSENLGEVKEALEIYKECYKYYKKQGITNKKYTEKYVRILFGIADVFKSLHQLDSCSFYNKMGEEFAKKNGEHEYEYLFILNEGANHSLRGNYTIALKEIDRALPIMKKYHNKINILASYYYYGKCYEGMHNKKLAVQNYARVDSIYQTDHKILTPEFVGGYQYLISYYKETGNKEKQLQYLTTYIQINSVLQKNYKELNNLLKKEYDLPHSLRDKEALINSLKNKNNYFICGVAGLLVALLILFLYQQRMKKIYHLRFEEIMKETEINKNKGVVTIEKNFLETKNVTISKEIIDQIIQKLKLFEKEKGYINSKISINSLADEFETNSKYLSKIVNEYKEKSFVTYINDLRIDYIILVLKEDKKMRKYNLQAIAIECGFNSAESFSTAFFKKTGIKPSFFIKELDKNSN